MNWQPIETAPKDGTVVIVATASGAWMAKYVSIYPSGYRPPNSWFSMMLNRDYLPRDGRYNEPTHWMPLPPPPSVEDGE